MIVVAATFVTLMLAGGPVTLPSGRDEVRFGVEAAQKGLWEEARFRFERALVLEPGNVKALNDLAIAYEQQGEFGKARDAYDKALKLRPGDDLIQQNYDLFREADDKRNRKTKTSAAAAKPAPPKVAPAKP